jgi:putative component of toxin-antitoxin plasmid stabilization module
VNEIRKTDVYARWLDGLRDIRARARTVIILLAGGDKRTQATDIKTALRLARNL